MWSGKEGRRLTMVTKIASLPTESTEIRLEKVAGEANVSEPWGLTKGPGKVKVRFTKISYYLSYMTLKGSLFLH